MIRAKMKPATKALQYCCPSSIECTVYTGH